MSLINHIQSFCNHLQSEKRFSENTVKSYGNDLEGLRTYLVRTYEIDAPQEISRQMLKSWLSSLKEEKMESRSINRKLSAVKSFFKYLLRHQVVSNSPADGIPSMKIKKKLPVFLEEKQVKNVLERSFYPSGFEGDTHHLVVSLFYQTGIRVSELASLKESDIHFSAQTISVWGKGNKQRYIPLQQSMLGLIAHYISEKKRVFESPNETLIVNEKNKSLSRTALYKIIRQILTEITTIQKKSPHVLRHSFATHMSDHGASIGAIKDLLGHSSLAATQVYTHTSIARLKEEYKKAHPKS